MFFESGCISIVETDCCREHSESQSSLLMGAHVSVNGQSVVWSLRHFRSLKSVQINLEKQVKVVTYKVLNTFG